jgi:LmbE family N-acetylglucosaminyl deacetylase
MPQSPIERDLTEALARLGLPPGARVLVLAGRESPLPALLSEAGLAPHSHDASQPLPQSTQPHDAAVVSGAFEQIEWDRWILQQLHGRLEPDAPLVLAARNLTSLATPGDVGWLALRALREVTAKIWRALRLPGGGAPPRFRGRRYTASRLRSLLDRLGFEIERFEPRGAGLTAPLATLAPSQARAFARHWLVVARAQHAGVLGGSVALPPCGEHVPAFEREQVRFLAGRDAWAARHPQAIAPSVQELDPRSFAGSCALVFAPHPDDEIIGCGGTLLRLVGAGARVVCVQATDGSDSHALRAAPEEIRRTIRLTEARAVAAAAGFHETVFWRADNRAFRATGELAEQAARLLRQHRPRLILTSFLTDIHPDHLTLNQILAEAIEAAGNVLEGSLVLGYEVWALAPPSLVCDVTGVREKQEALLWTYTTAMKVDDFIALCERRNYYHACRLLRRAGYAEVFHAVPAREYPALVAAALRR